MPRKKKEKEQERELAGYVDEEGSRYLHEIDLLKWSNSILRIRNLRHQASETRTRLENLRLDYEMKRQQHLIQADAFEKAANSREKNDHVNLMKEMGARYGVEFDDPNIVLDDATGKIKLIDPLKE